MIVKRLALLIILTTIVVLRASLARPHYAKNHHSTLDPAAKIHAGWTSFVNTNYIAGIAIDGDCIWTVGGGVKRYNLKTNRYTVFCTEHGIASNDTRAIAIDDDFVWVATAGGVSRYSKQEGTWRNYFKGDGLPDEMLVSMFLDKNNKKIWFGSWDSGITSYDIRQNEWKSFSIKDGLSNNCVISIAYDSSEEALWCGTWGGGVNQLNCKTGEWKNWNKASGLPSDTITATAVDGDSVWFGTLSAGISRYHKGADRWEHITKKMGLAGNEISSVVVDASSNSVWVGTRDGGLCRFRKDSGRWESIGEKEGLLREQAGINISAIALTTNNQILLGTWGNGFIKYDCVGQSAQSFRAPNEIAHNRVVTMFADRGKKRMWFGTEGGGASSYDLTTGQWRGFTSAMKMLPDDTVNEIAVTIGQDGKREVVWFGTLDGIVSIAGLGRPYRQGLLRSRRVLSHALIESFALDYKRKVLWSGTNNRGLYWYNLVAGKWRHIDDLPNYIFHSLAWDEQEEVVWCGTETGMVGYDLKRNKKITFESLSEAEIRSVVLDNKRAAIWAGSWGSGLFRYDKGKKRWVRYTKADGLPGDTIVGLALDDEGGGTEALWVGTDRGVAKYYLNAQQWQRFDTKDGLAHNFVLAVAVDGSGAVWFGTWGGGVSRYDPK